MDDWLMDCVFYEAFDEEARFANYGACSFGWGGGGGSSYLFETKYFDGKVVAETDKAYLINSTVFNNVNLWFPKSQVENSTDNEEGLTNFGIPRWLYNKKIEEGKNELAVETKYKTVECNVMAQTSLSWLLKLEGKEFWVPTSQMKSRKFDRAKEKWIVEVTEWILNKNMKEKDEEEVVKNELKIVCENSSFPFLAHKRGSI